MTPQEELDEQFLAAQEEARSQLAAWASGATLWLGVWYLLGESIRDGHTNAHRLGRALGGRAVPDPFTDGLASARVWLNEQTYWQRFSQDVQMGRYGSPLSIDNPARPDAVYQRVRLYHNKWVATANAGWIDTLVLEQEPGAEDELFEWIRNPLAESCTQCIEWEANGPYTIDTLPALPGDGSSDCGTACKCECRNIQSGQMGFQVPSLS